MMMRKHDKKTTTKNKREKSLCFPKTTEKKNYEI